MDLFSCVAAVENHRSPVFAPLLPRLCTAPFVFACFFIPCFSWFTTSKVSREPSPRKFPVEAPDLQTSVWEHVSGCVSVDWRVPQYEVCCALLFASTFLFSEVSSLECTAVSFACPLSKRTGCSLSLCRYICPRTHIHTFSSKCVHGAERMAASEQWNI